MGTTVKDLMAMDQAFSDESEKKGILAWTKRFAEEGILIIKTGHYVKGPKEVAERLAALFSKKDLEFKWVPEGGGLSDDGTLGYTYGHYHSHYMDEDQEMNVKTGHYTTIWRKVDDKHWKIELDIGN